MLRLPDHLVRIRDHADRAHAATVTRHAALRALTDQANSVPREVVSAVVGICHFARAWGVAPDGMLRGNGLIGDEDAARLEKWIWTISYALSMILDGDAAEAFSAYDDERLR
ncbi:hypothetical protein DL990_22100 [Amycolatopsis sp. WAC 01416]|nr:hypothetical protein DL990_22100 [Amycolatopsis sp. WAC 01416]